MKKFQKLSRAEMKNVRGGLVQPGHGDDCKDECTSDADCSTSGDTCKSWATSPTACPDIKTRKICVPAGA